MRRAAFLVPVAGLLAAAAPAQAPHTGVFAALDPAGDYDRYVLHVSGPENVARVEICEPNVKWSCESSDARFKAIGREAGSGGGRSWFKSDGSILLWNKKKLYLRTYYGDGAIDTQILEVTESHPPAADLSDAHVGGAAPNPALAGKACVFAFSPVPEAAHDGSRGKNYFGHRTSRDYQAPVGTPLYAMGTCEVVKRIDSAIEHPCGYGLAMRCKLGQAVMGVLYCHMDGPAVNKRFFGMGEFVGRSGKSGTDVPHLHLALTYDTYDKAAPRDPALEDEDLLTPGLPVAGNDPDKWLAANGCYVDPAPTGPRPDAELPPRKGPAPQRPILKGWDGQSFKGNDAWQLVLENSLQ